MNEKKEFERLKFSKTKIYIAMILILILFISFIIQYTTAMRTYMISYLVNVILNNSINILAISGLLIFMNCLEIKIAKKKLEK